MSEQPIDSPLLVSPSIDKLVQTSETFTRGPVALGDPAPSLGLNRPSRPAAAIKRSLDVVGALAVGLVSTPVWVVVVVLVRATSRGPVIFRQQRVGRDGVPFKALKFRTMRADAEAQLHLDTMLSAQHRASNFKLPDGEDPRVTRIGRLLRRSSLDELPQLLNILSGSMTLVGPRPVVPSELGQYGERAALYTAVKPGLTGWWQISGRSNIGYPERVDFDEYYIRNQSLLLDLRILIRTPAAVFFGRGAH